MSQASDLANLYAQRPDPTWHTLRIRLAINVYADCRRKIPEQEPEFASILYFTLLEVTDMANRHQVGELGRQLANWRDDLIAQGAEPADLPIPVHPEDI